MHRVNPMQEHSSLVVGVFGVRTLTRHLPSLHRRPGAPYSCVFEPKSRHSLSEPIIWFHIRALSNVLLSCSQKCPLSLLFTPVHSIAVTAHQLGSRAGHCIGMTQTQHTPMTKADLPRLMTRPEVADYLNISTGTLANWNSAGTGPTPVKWNSQSVMYLPEDVLDWVHSRRAE